MSSAEQPSFLTVSEYLLSEEQAHTKSEYVNGWVRAMGGATLRHNQVVGNCFVSLAISLKGKACRPFNSDTKLRIDRLTDKRFYYPDLQVVCRSNLPGSVYQDEPVLIIEVLSPSTRQYDLDEKLNAYLEISSLECYLIFEQHQPIATIMRRTQHGFLRQVVEGVDSFIDLPFLDCTMFMKDVYEGVEFTDQCVQEPQEDYLAAP